MIKEFFKWINEKNEALEKEGVILDKMVFNSGAQEDEAFVRVEHLKANAIYGSIDFFEENKVRLHVENDAKEKTLIFKVHTVENSELFEELLAPYFKALLEEVEVKI